MVDRAAAINLQPNTAKLNDINVQRFTIKII
jgi:hypothetical protein